MPWTAVSSCLPPPLPDWVLPPPAGPPSTLLPLTVVAACAAEVAQAHRVAPHIVCEAGDAHHRRPDLAACCQSLHLRLFRCSHALLLAGGAACKHEPAVGDVAQVRLFQKHPHKLLKGALRVAVEVGVLDQPKQALHLGARGGGEGI